MPTRDRTTHPGASDGTGWFFAAYGGLAGFFAIERAVRQPGAAASLSAPGGDQRTTQKIVAAYAAGAVLAPVVRRSPLGRLPRGAAPIGLALEAGGLALRVWSMRTLGASYSRTLRRGEAQPLIDDGPYRLVRHPGYAGSLLTWSGFAIASRSLPVGVVVSGLLGWAYRDRIRAEEALLRRELPGYEDYIRRTWRLVPYLW